MFGRQAYARTTDIPGVVDLAVIVVPAAHVLPVVDDCIAKGVKALVVISAGFGEVGAEGRVLEAALLDKVRAAGVRMVGPNCMGLLNTHLPLNITAAPLVAPPGHLSLVSSVAGYRGLPKSLAYGPTKAALINLAECLYFDLTDRGIGVSVVCPGYVDTPLTEQNDYKMPGLIKADEAAEQIVRGWQKGKFEMHFPKRFTGWVKALSHAADWLYFMTVRRATGL